MNPSSSLAFIKRNDLLKLLSDNEVASVSLAETAVQLSDGDEYLDLSNLDKGVRSARKETSFAAKSTDPRDLEQHPGAAGSDAYGAGSHASVAGPLRSRCT